MYCAHCGTEIKEGQNFCNACGRPANAAPSAASSAAPGLLSTPARTRLSRHLQVLGILWIVGSILRLIPGLALLFFSHTGLPFVPAQVRWFLFPLLGGLGVFFSAVAVAGLITGWGLLERRPWARMLAIILGCVALIHVPFGTALGIYTLWVLIPEGADTEYRRLAQAH